MDSGVKLRKRLIRIMEKLDCGSKLWKQCTLGQNSRKNRFWVKILEKRFWGKILEKIDSASKFGKKKRLQSKIVEKSIIGETSGKHGFWVKILEKIESGPIFLKKSILGQNSVKINSG